jgi:cytochrome c551/c552
MKTTARIAIAALTAAFLFPAGALAQADDPLKANGCLNCHEKDKKKVGPSFKDSAAKGVKPDDVVAKMKEGKGHPKLAKPEADLKKAVETALSAK